MKINERTALSTSKVLLVPYSASHVPTYHEWMQDPSLQAATASEPLSLPEEYAMQTSWREDRDKLTFIICHPLPSHSPPPKSIQPGEFDAPDNMIGDINLFLFEPDTDDLLQSVALITPSTPSLIGELELMIALPQHRHRGYGRAALLTFIDYILTHWTSIAMEYAKDKLPPQLSFLRVKVQEGNLGSVRLFESLGFVRVSEKANYFGELELRWLPDLRGVRGGKGWEGSVEVGYGDAEVVKD